MESARARSAALEAAEDLFYSRGIQAVGMDEIRAASGVSLKRLYALFPSKSALVRACLEARDTRWRARLAAYVDSRPGPPQDRVLAVFDWLHAWFSEPGFRGCAFINSFGELGATDASVADVTRLHKDAFRAYVTGLVVAAGRPEESALAYVLLAEGAIVTAAVSGTPEPAHHAGRAAAQLLADTAVT
ncbi:TetR/AcrR family transcriptional regulator [Streptomyces sp. NPDC060209]|uniref:TetR/AcrR family transcriptional regulator n=1 Tax=Streptomyces sp. NPDC060209 TaxID=3347073 RepID=UPI003669149B